MNKILTEKEITKIMELCFSNPAKACAVAQIVVDTCQIVSCTTYAGVKNISPRGVQYKANSLTGIKIGKRKYISINQ